MTNYPGEASPSAVEAVLLMTLFCVLACWGGYRLSPNRWIVEHAVIPVDRNRLFQGGIFYVFVAYYFTYLISQMTLAERGGYIWSGKVTLYQFLAGLISPGLSICLSHALRSRSQAAWLMTG